MRDKPYFELINNTDGFNGITAHCRGGKVLNSLDDVVNELNSLEKRRVDLNRDKQQLRAERRLLYDVVDGVRAYIRLREKEWLWAYDE